MKTSFILGAVTVAGLTAGAAFAGTLDDVKARGKLNCGVSTGVPGFAEPGKVGTELKGTPTPSLLNFFLSGLLGAPQAPNLVIWNSLRFCRTTSF